MHVKYLMLLAIAGVVVMLGNTTSVAAQVTPDDSPGLDNEETGTPPTPIGPGITPEPYQPPRGLFATEPNRNRFTSPYTPVRPMRGLEAEGVIREPRLEPDRPDELIPRARQGLEAHRILREPEPLMPSTLLVGGTEWRNPWRGTFLGVQRGHWTGIPTRFPVVWIGSMR